MVFLIDPCNLKGKQCPHYICDILCSLCETLCSTVCGGAKVPLYGVPDPPSVE